MQDELLKVVSSTVMGIGSEEDRMLRDARDEKIYSQVFPSFFTTISVCVYLSLAEVNSLSIISKSFSEKIKRKKILEEYLAFLMTSVSVLHRGVERAVRRKISGDRYSVYNLVVTFRQTLFWSSEYIDKSTKVKNCIRAGGPISGAAVSATATVALASQGYLPYVYLTLTTSVGALLCGALSCFCFNKIPCVKRIVEDEKWHKERFSINEKSLICCETVEKAPVPMLQTVLNLIEEKRNKAEEEKQKQEEKRNKAEEDKQKQSEQKTERYFCFAKS